MRLLHLVEVKPKNKIKLDPLTEDDYNISKDMVNISLHRSKNGVKTTFSCMSLSYRMEWHSSFVTESF